jgi:hypothetical protein
MVGVRGIEPPTSASQAPRATGLRYTPTGENDYTHDKENNKAQIRLFKRPKA